MTFDTNFDIRRSVQMTWTRHKCKYCCHSKHRECCDLMRKIVTCKNLWFDENNLIWFFFVKSQLASCTKISLLLLHKYKYIRCNYINLALNCLRNFPHPEQHGPHGPVGTMLFRLLQRLLKRQEYNKIICLYSSFCNYINFVRASFHKVWK